jgi:hypothetical protein
MEIDPRRTGNNRGSRLGVFFKQAPVTACLSEAGVLTQAADSIKFSARNERQITFSICVLLEPATMLLSK